MYALLRRYEVRVPAKELDAVSDLRYSWRKLHDLASVTSNALSQLQVVVVSINPQPESLNPTPGASCTTWPPRHGLRDLPTPSPSCR